MTKSITTSRPGNSHIGKPLRVIDQGETMINPVTFEDYIKGLRSSWNAQLFMSHSLELSSLISPVGEELLPHQFLSTPLGASMRPMINQMFRLVSGHSNHHQISSSSNQPTTPIGLLSNLTSTIHNNSNLSKGSGPRSVTSLEALTSELQHNVCVVVNFTNEPGCPPCRTIAPVGAGEALSGYGIVALKQGYSTPFLNLPRPYTFCSTNEFFEGLYLLKNQISREGYRGPMVSVIITGWSCRVGGGAVETLDQAGIQWVESLVQLCHELSQSKSLSFSLFHSLSSLKSRED
ncbi:hypothetical protein BY996DRAFT_6423288 [Phakopsora pachyrhizi]|nr:hypothetical protein BY996DRAFT_6423288 [Phakopsora pachyrhizi]